MLKVRINLKTAFCEISVPQTIDLEFLFNDLKKHFDIDGDSSNYYFYTTRPIEISPDVKINSLIRGRNVPSIALITREEYKTCLERGPYVRSLKNASMMLNDQQRQMLMSVCHTRSIVNHYFDKDSDCLADLLDILPFDILGSDEPEENLTALTKWFKEDFFTFVKSPPCHICGGPTEMIGNSRPTQYEKDGKANNVELHMCHACTACTRFPRYDLPERLIKTRKGRCMEFANVFTGMLLSLGFDARLVLDFTDHVWTEVWLDSKQRYVHVDPCENIIDAPYTYEKGWGKKLTWVLAFGHYEVYDVTPRYTQDIEAVKDRRRRDIPEEWYEKFIAFRNAQWQKDLDEEEKEEIRHKNELDQKSMEVIREETKSEEERPRISGNE